MNHKALNVIQDKRLVGELRVVEGHWQFVYNEVWLRAEIFAPSLSPLLAKQIAPYIDTNAARPVQDFFENMLPDGSMRQVVSQVRGHEDSFELLSSMGHDLPGSLSLEPKEKMRTNGANLHRLSVGAYPDMQGFTALIATSGVAPGTQLKLAADMQGTVLTTLDNSRASRVIIKAGHADLASISSEPILNEWFCTRLAKQIGFDTSYFEVSRLFGGSMIIHRFDRMRKGQRVDRLPVINGCQALGIGQKNSFESLSAQSLSQLSKLTSQPGKTLKRLFAWVGYNAIIGNRDIELNDLSFSMSVYESRSTKLSLMPVYDLSSRLEGSSDKPSASVFRGQDLKAITFDQIVDIADEMNYNTESAHVDLEDMLFATRNALQSMLDLLEKEVSLVHRYESIRLGAAERSYLKKVGDSIEAQVERLAA